MFNFSELSILIVCNTAFYKLSEFKNFNLQHITMKDYIMNHQCSGWVKYTLAILFFFMSIISYGQIIDINYSKGGDDQQREEEAQKPEVLAGGFVNYLSSGNMQASANLLKIYIGEPDAFYVPFFIYTGVSGDNLSAEKSLNELTVSDLINSAGGTVNASFNGLQNLYSKEGKLTKLRFNYNLGAKVVNGKDSINLDNKSVVNGFVNLGLFFQTGAWEPTDTDNIGMFWADAKMIAGFSSQEDMQLLFGQEMQGNLIGYSFGAGIAINKVIDVNLRISQYTNVSNIEAFKDPIIQFSLDYKRK